MKAHYGYKDGAGEFFIVIDTDRCDGCGDCVTACPAGVFESIVDDYDDAVVAVTEEHRRDLKYACAPCKPVTDRAPLPCVEACTPEAIGHSW